FYLAHYIKYISESRLTKYLELAARLLQIVPYLFGLADFKIDHISVSFKLIKLRSRVDGLFVSEFYLDQSTVDGQDAGFAEIRCKSKCLRGQFLFRLGEYCVAILVLIRNDRKRIYRPILDFGELIGRLFCEYAGRFI